MFYNIDKTCAIITYYLFVGIFIFAIILFNSIPMSCSTHEIAYPDYLREMENLSDNKIEFQNPEIAFATPIIDEYDLNLYSPSNANYENLADGYIATLSSNDMRKLSLTNDFQNQYSSQNQSDLCKKWITLVNELKIPSPPLNEIVAPRTQVTLECDIAKLIYNSMGTKFKQNVSNPDIIWMYNGRIIENGNRDLNLKRVRLSVDGQYLHISSYHKRKHSGFYQCLLKIASCGTILGSPTRLSHPTRIPKIRNKLKLSSGSTAIISCDPFNVKFDLHGYDSNVSIERQNSNLPIYSADFNFVSQDQQEVPNKSAQKDGKDRILRIENYLLIRDLKPSDSDTYICSAYSPAIDKDQRFGTIELAVVPSTKFKLPIGYSLIPPPIINNPDFGYTPTLKIDKIITLADELTLERPEQKPVMPTGKSEILPCFSNNYTWYWYDNQKGALIPFLASIKSFNTTIFDTTAKIELDKHNYLRILFTGTSPFHLELYCVPSSYLLSYSANIGDHKDPTNPMQDVMIHYAITSMYKPHILTNQTHYAINNLKPSIYNYYNNVTTSDHTTNEPVFELQFDCPVHGSSNTKYNNYTVLWIYDGQPISNVIRELSTMYPDTLKVKYAERTIYNNSNHVTYYSLNINLTLSFAISDGANSQIILLKRLLNGYLQCQLIIEEAVDLSTTRRNFNLTSWNPTYVFSLKDLNLADAFVPGDKSPQVNYHVTNVKFNPVASLIDSQDVNMLQVDHNSSWLNMNVDKGTQLYQDSEIVNKTVPNIKIPRSNLGDVFTINGPLNISVKQDDSFNLTCSIPNNHISYYRNQIGIDIGSLIGEESSLNQLDDINEENTPFVIFDWMKNNQNIRYSDEELWENGRASFGTVIKKGEDNTSLYQSILFIHHAKPKDAGRYLCVVSPNPVYIEHVIERYNHQQQQLKSKGIKNSMFEVEKDHLIRSIKLQKSNVAYVTLITDNPNVTKSKFSTKPISNNILITGPNHEPLLLHSEVHSTFLNKTTTALPIPPLDLEKVEKLKHLPEDLINGDSFKFTINQSPNINYDYAEPKYGNPNKVKSADDINVPTILISPNAYADKNLLIKKLSQTAPSKFSDNQDNPKKKLDLSVEEKPISLFTNEDYNSLITNEAPEIPADMKNVRKKTKNKSTSPKTTIKNKPKDIMIPPDRPNITQISNSSVLVEWDVSPNNGIPIIFFKVQYRQLQALDPEWKTLSDIIRPDFTSFHVPNLFPGGIYKFRVAAVYENYDNRHSPNSLRFRLVPNFKAKNMPPNGTLLLHTPRLVLSELHINAPIIMRVWPETNSTFKIEWIHREPGLSQDQINKIDQQYCHPPPNAFGKYGNNQSSNTLEPTISFYIQYRPSGSVSKFTKYPLVGQKQNFLHQSHSELVYQQEISLTNSSETLLGISSMESDLPSSFPRFPEVTRFEVRISAVLYCLDGTSLQDDPTAGSFNKLNSLPIPINIILTSPLSNPKYLDMSKFLHLHQEINRDHGYLAHPPPKSFKLDPEQHSFLNSNIDKISNSILPPIPSTLEELKKLVVKSKHTLDSSKAGGASIHNNQIDSAPNSDNQPHKIIDSSSFRRDAFEVHGKAPPVSSSFISSRLFYIVLGNVLTFLLVLLFAATLACYCKHKNYVKDYYTDKSSRKSYLANNNDGFNNRNGYNHQRLRPDQRRLSLINAANSSLGSSPIKGDTSTNYSPINYGPDKKPGMFKRVLNGLIPSTRLSSQNNYNAQRLSSGYRDLGKYYNSSSNQMGGNGGPLMILDLLKNQKNRPKSLFLGQASLSDRYQNLTDTTSFTNQHQLSFRTGMSAISTNGTLNSRKSFQRQTTYNPHDQPPNQVPLMEERQSLLATNGSLLPYNINMNDGLRPTSLHYNTLGIKNSIAANQLSHQQINATTTTRQRPSSIVFSGFENISKPLAPSYYNLLRENGLPYKSVQPPLRYGHPPTNAINEPQFIFPQKGCPSHLPVNYNLSTLPRNLYRSPQFMMEDRGRHFASNTIDFRRKHCDRVGSPPRAKNTHYALLHPVGEEDMTLSPPPIGPTCSTLVSFQNTSHNHNYRNPLSIDTNRDIEGKNVSLPIHNTIYRGSNEGGGTGGPSSLISSSITSRNREKSNLSNQSNRLNAQNGSNCSPINNDLFNSNNQKQPSKTIYYYDTFGRRRSRASSISNNTNINNNNVNNDNVNGNERNEETIVNSTFKIAPQPDMVDTNNLAITDEERNNGEDLVQIYSTKINEIEDDGVVSFKRDSLLNASAVSKGRKFLRTSDRRSSRSNSGASSNRIKNKSSLMHQHNGFRDSPLVTDNNSRKDSSKSPTSLLNNSKTIFKSEKNLLVPKGSANQVNLSRAYYTSSQKELRSFASSISPTKNDSRHVDKFNQHERSANNLARSARNLFYENNDEGLVNNLSTQPPRYHETENEQFQSGRNSNARSSINNTMKFESDIHDFLQDSPNQVVLTSFKPPANNRFSPFKKNDLKNDLNKPNYCANNERDRYSYATGKRRFSTTNETNSNASSNSRNDLNVSNFPAVFDYNEPTPFKRGDQAYSSFVNQQPQHHQQNHGKRDILNSSYLSRGSSFNNHQIYDDDEAAAALYSPRKASSSTNNFKLFNLNDSELLNHNSPTFVNNKDTRGDTKRILGKVSDIEFEDNEQEPDQGIYNERFPQIPEFDDANFIENINHLYGQVCSAFNSYSRFDNHQPIANRENALAYQHLSNQVAHQESHNRALVNGHLENQFNFENGMQLQNGLNHNFNNETGKNCTSHNEKYQINPIILDEDDDDKWHQNFSNQLYKTQHLFSEDMNGNNFNNREPLSTFQTPQNVAGHHHQNKVNGFHNHPSLSLSRSANTNNIHNFSNHNNHVSTTLISKIPINNGKPALKSDDTQPPSSFNYVPDNFGNSHKHLNEKYIEKLIEYVNRDTS